MSEELELKYLIDEPRSVRQWLDSTFPPAADERWRSFSMVDRYFDTADGALAAAGYGARLRRTGGRTTLTLKSDVDVTGALHLREELEAPATNELDVSKWPPSVARERLAAVVGGRRLIERFTVRQRRRERHLSTGGAVLLASVDTGTVFAAGTEAGEIAQLEVERVSGRRAALTRIAKAAEASGLARAESRSKLAIAAEMSTAAARVDATDAFAEAGRKVLRRHLLRMLERETGMRAGDELALKQMRVATRRMRATLLVFGDAYKSRVRRRFNDDLRRLGRALGAARDMDVLLASLPEDQGGGALAEHWRTRRSASLEELLALLGSRPYARFVDEMLEFTATPGAGTARRSADVSVAQKAPTALGEAFERVRTAGAEAVGGDDATAWHALRIEGRRLRYSVEAFTDVLAGPPAKELLVRVTRVQDHLGAMNDAAVAIEEVSLWLAETGEGVDCPTADALARYIAVREAEIVSLRKSFGAAWRGVSGVTFERLLERAARLPAAEQR